MMYLYSVKDVKIGFNTPKPAVTDGQIIRMFVSAVQDDREGNEFNLYANDMELWRIGQFNEVTGELLPEQPHCICLGRTYIKPKGTEVYEKLSLLADVPDDYNDPNPDLSRSGRETSDYLAATAEPLGDDDL